MSLSFVDDTKKKENAIVHVRVFDGGERVVMVGVSRLRDEDVLDIGSVMQRDGRGRNAAVWSIMRQLQYICVS
jgi:hypothetical protein